jgi:hypothetical protein
MELAGWFRQPAFDLQQQFLAPARESAQHSRATSIQGQRAFKGWGEKAFMAGRGISTT